MDGAPKWRLVTLGCVCSAVGLAALGYALLLWVGIGLDKQTFDAGTTALLVALGVIGVLLILAGSKVIRRTGKSAS